MKFSLNSLNNFIDLKDFFNKPDELSGRLSSAGFEVESREVKKTTHLIVVQIKEKKAHPSADRLSLCQVQARPDHLLPIVCGATNFKEGDKAVLALPGAVLPGGLKIKARKIRGETSEGMLLSLGELGFGSSDKENNPSSPEDSGILILPQDVEVGLDFADYVGLNDVIFEVDITPNRPDCLSHFGMARELSCLLDRKLKMDCSQGAVKGEGPSFQELLGVEVKQPKLCTRYTGRAVYGVKVKPSPLWLRVCLEHLGFKSINNIVDITNYFLIQWGQPLHAFDLDLLKGKILIDYSQKGENFKTLDDQEIHLSGKELCIRDKKQNLALAGVIGGVNSGIRPETKNVFLESACFEAAQVRSTSKRFNIETDSSYRFSRGVPGASTLDLSRKAVAFIRELAGGTISKDEYDFRTKPEEQKAIEIQEKDLERRLGMKPSFGKFQNWMEKLQCKVQVEADPKRAKVTPPFFRFDLHIKEDLIEEYARLGGYDKIPEEVTYLNGFPMKDQKEYTLSNKVVEALVHEGFYQAINHSFISHSFSDSFLGIKTDTKEKEKKETFTSYPFLGLSMAGKEAVFIRNPLSSEYNMMRVSLIPSLFKNAEQSIRHGCLQARLFEWGSVFMKEAGGTVSERKERQSAYEEYNRLGLIAWGQEENLWEKNKDRLCIYDLKTALNSLLRHFNIHDYEWSKGKEAPPFIHPYQYMILKCNDKEMAYIGSLNPVYAEKHKVRVNMAFAEVNTECFFNSVKRDFQSLSPYPLVERDLSFIVPKDFPAGDIIKGIKKMAGSICRSVKIFDLYKNEKNIKSDVRSISFRLVLQSDKETLTEENLQKLQIRLTKELVSQYPIQLR